MKEQINELLKKVGLKAEEIKLAQMKLADGITIVEAEAFEAGYSIGIVTEEGVVALPKGEYEMEDGKALIVEEDGVIAEIKDAVSEEEAAEEGEMMDEKEEMSSEPQPKKVVESVTKESFFSKELHDALVNEIAELKAQLESKEEVTEEVEMSSDDEPAAEVITHNPERANEVKFQYGTSRNSTTLDRIMAKLSK